MGFPVLRAPGAGSEEGGWGRDPAAGLAVQAGAQTDAFKLAGDRVEGLRAAAESAPRAIPAGPWFPPKPGTRCAGRVEQTTQRSSFLR